MVRHTDEKIKRAAERLADDVDAADIQAQSTDDLQQVAVASDAIPADEVRLRQAVQIARGHGRFWNQTSVALGVSREAARQRFADKANA